jgi:hypothetical protein
MWVCVAVSLYFIPDIHASSEFRAHDLNVRASEDISCLSPRGRCDRQRGLLIYIFI